MYNCSSVHAVPPVSSRWPRETKLLLLLLVLMTLARSEEGEVVVVVVGNNCNNVL